VIDQVIPVLHVTSARVAEVFYCGQLGFRRVFPLGEVPPGPCYMGVVRDGAVIHLSSHAGDGVVGGVAYLVVDSVDLLHEELARKRVPIHLGPTDQTWGMREMYVRDPDGNTIRFGQPGR